MDNEDLINSASGYIAGNAISQGIVGNMRRYREANQRYLKHVTPEETLATEVAKFILSENKDGAFEYLNERFKEEIVDVAQRQNDFIYSLDTIINKRVDKYKPFYQRIGMDMPEQLQYLTADALCESLGIENLHIIDSVDGKTSPSHPKEDFDFSLLFRAVFIIICFLLIMAKCVGG